jgi:hypothetical protein
MKVILQANEDIRRDYGGVRLKAAKGEKIALKASEAEIALQTGGFTYVRAEPEAKHEAEVIEQQEATLEAQKAELLELSKDELAARAENLDGYKKSMSKDEIVDLILSPRPNSATEEK